MKTVEGRGGGEIRRRRRKIEGKEPKGKKQLVGS